MKYKSGTTTIAALAFLVMCCGRPIRAAQVDSNAKPELGSSGSEVLDRSLTAGDVGVY
jgi:hypothetical protein